MKNFLDKIFRRSSMLLHMMFLIVLGIALGIRDQFNIPYLGEIVLVIVGIYIGLAFLYVAPSIPKTIVGLWRKWFPKKVEPVAELPVDKTGEDQIVIHDEKSDIYKQFSDSLAAVNKYRALNPAPIQQEVVEGILLTDKPERFNSGSLSESKSGDVSKDTSTGSEPKPVKKSTRRRTRSTKAGAKKPGNTNQKPQSSSKA